MFMELVFAHAEMLMKRYEEVFIIFDVFADPAKHFFIKLVFSFLCHSLSPPFLI